MSITPPPEGYALDKDDPSGDNLLLACRAFGRWPHFLNKLALEYDAPLDLIVIVLFLWDATVGHNGSDGEISRTQFPAGIRRRNLTKWLAALVSADLFDVETAGRDSKKGSHYFYRKDAEPELWESFFAKAGWLQHFPGWDRCTPETFAAMFSRGRLSLLATVARSSYERTQELIQAEFNHPLPAVQLKAARHIIDKITEGEND